jgi:hypothetical protein
MEQVGKLSKIFVQKHIKWAKGSNLLGLDQVAGFCDGNDEPSGCINCREFLD